MKKFLLAALMFVVCGFLSADAQTVFTGGGGGGGASTPCTVTAGSVQYNNAGAFGCTTDWTSDGTTLTAALGTITTNVKALNITGTWNNNALAFDAPLFMNIVTTTNGTPSYLFDFQVGGASKLAFVGNSGSTSYVNALLFGSVNSAIWSPGAETINIGDGSGAHVSFGTNIASGRGAIVRSDGFWAFSNSTDAAGGSVDAMLLRVAPKVVGVADGSRVVDATIEASNFVSTPPVPVDGAGSCTATGFVGGASAGTFVAPVCAAGTIAITFAFTAPTGWSCDAEDRTTISTGKLQQTASTTTKATFTATTTASDVIQYKCMAY